MDDGAPKLPSDLEQPVITPPAATPPPVTPPNPTPLPVIPPTITPPPTPPPTDVPEESPQPIKPKSNFKKNLPKVAGGLLVMALLIGGILAGGNLLQQRTQVEQQAECKPGTVTVKGKTKEVCKDGKKVEEPLPESQWETLRNLRDETGIDRLKDVSYNSEDSLAKAVQYSTFTANGGGVVITQEEADIIKQRLANLTNSGKITEFRFGGTVYTNTADILNQIYKIQGGTSFFFCEGGDEAQCNTIDYSGFISFIESGDKCGTIQFDAVGTLTGPGGLVKIPCGGEAGERTTEDVPGPSPTPGVSPSPTPTPSPSLSCVDLTSNKAAPVLNDSVNFTCEANFSAVSPVAFFRHNVNSGTYTTSAGINVDLTSRLATYSATINQVGNWLAECRVCTDSSATSCTAWGQAN